jgi:hypothetical protein
MTTNSASRTDDERKARIAEIKETLQRIAGGKMICEESPAMSLERREQFWEQVLAAECDEGPYTTDIERLAATGVDMPAPESLDDAALSAKLWEVIHALEKMNVLLEYTNHLNDRELYVQLWSHSLRCEIPVSDYEGDGDWHLDMISTGSAENIRAWLKYYADDATRRKWAEDFPDDEVPAHEAPPHDRDRQLHALYYEGDVVI